MKFRNILTILLILLSSIFSIAQEKNYYQTDFSKEEFATRRTKIFEAIGKESIAVLQGAAGTPGVSVFRQANNFYYLTGIESSHAYLLLNGRSKKATLYLPHRDIDMERNQGKVLSAEDADLVKALTGIDEVKGLEDLAADLSGAGLIRPPAPSLYLEFSPAESGNDSRDELLAKQVMSASDPWDGSASREGAFIRKINLRFPQFKIEDLSPSLDAMRSIKSKREIRLIREATQVAGLAIIEAMKSTKPGVYEYQLGAAAKYVFSMHGAMGDSYPAIIGGGTNAYMGHYFHKTEKLVDGDLVLMDYAPDYKYYSSDVTRIWPVNGKFNEEQRALYEFILAYRDAFFTHIKPGVSSNEVLDLTAADMKNYMVGKKFVKPAHLKAVEEGIDFRGHFQHPVGMTVHDVGRVHGVKLEAGMVFTIDPMIWIDEQRLYVRIEDVALVTEDGVENLSDFVPSSIEEIEKTIAEKGLIDFLPASELPFK
jgi:Xaa-Pro aminopeptidase